MLVKILNIIKINSIKSIYCVLCYFYNKNLLTRTISFIFYLIYLKVEYLFHNLESYISSRVFLIINRMETKYLIVIKTLFRFQF